MDIKTIATAGIAEKMQTNKDFNDFVYSSLNRHFCGDWGDVSADDAATNAADPLCALSAYTALDGRKIWIKQDYNVVTVLFPSEY